MSRLTHPIVALAAFLFAGVATFDAVQVPARVVITRFFTPADQLKGRYQYVPFEVPKGRDALRVTYAYDTANGGNVVDLGLFEPGPLALGTRAFRGYSGGARAEVSIDAGAATPGYLPGPLPAGQWHALLGLYRIAPAGVEVTLTIDTAPTDRRAPVQHSPPAPKLRPQAPGWFTGALHTHTLHSDGTVSPGELLRLFAEKGFDFVAITDHNNTTHTRELEGLTQAYPLRIVGEEVTTPGGHASVWGLPEGGWVDFRVLPGDARIRELVAAARQQGAIFSINHPVSECLACGWTHAVVDGIDGIEISNGRHGDIEKAIAHWDRLLVSGRRITGVGSSDWHSAPNPIDNAHVRVHASSLTKEGVLAAIRAGRVIVMTDAREATPGIVVRAPGRSAGIGESLVVPSGTPLDVEVSAPAAARGRLVIVTSGRRGGPIALDGEGHASVQVAAAAGYLRFELQRADGSAMAWTNPVYLER